MKQVELEALEDVTPSFGRSEYMVSGRIVCVPRAGGFDGALFQKPEDGVFLDKSGLRWQAGWIGDRHVRRLALLEGALLDAAVAKAEGKSDFRWTPHGFRPSDTWEDGGPGPFHALHRPVRYCMRPRLRL